jgi:7,8-dihydro-6-hydroxymethylpterin-pyrophosphokinase
MKKREFVLLPLAEIAADLIVPSSIATERQSISVLSQEIANNSMVKLALS